MLSKQVKRHTRARRAARVLSRTAQGRRMVRLAKAGNTQQLLSSKHIVDLDADRTWGLGLQQRMINSENRRRSNFSDILDSDTPVVKSDELLELERQRLDLIGKYTESQPGAWQPGFKEND